MSSDHEQHTIVLAALLGELHRIDSKAGKESRKARLGKNVMRGRGFYEDGLGGKVTASRINHDLAAAGHEVSRETQPVLGGGAKHPRVIVFCANNEIVTLTVQQ
jgi:hypothetical protein